MVPPIVKDSWLDKHASKLKERLVSVLQHNSSFVVANRENNVFILSVMKLVEKLAKFGLFQGDEQVVLMTLLFKMLEDHNPAMMEQHELTYVIMVRIGKIHSNWSSKSSTRFAERCIVVTTMIFSDVLQNVCIGSDKNL